MFLAQLIEEKNVRLKLNINTAGPGSSRPMNQNFVSPARSSASGQHMIRATLPTEVKEGSRKEPQFKRLMEAEIIEKRAKGLCYRCDEKFVLGHRCKLRELQVLMVLNDEEYGESAEIEGLRAVEIIKGNVLEIRKAGEGTESNHITGVGLSLNYLVGLTSSKTMKLQGLIRTQPVVVLIDSGATHNLISQDLVRKLAIPVDTTRAYGVLMGTESVQGVGICKQVGSFARCGSNIRFLPLNLTSSDVILGIQWLETLCNVHINWKLQRMGFQIQGQKVILQGNPSLCRSLVSLKAMIQAVQMR